ncbi:hypothetical protein B7494_g5581 [Chlorociboria aeruginascens]|nr:hypothetical protein B7494_g5581 [Chlorociboria aeruginascens]
MTDKEKGGMEILVHVSAPSRGQDDVRYRALAQAFLSFEPGRCCNMDGGPINDPEDHIDHLADSQLQEDLIHSTHEERESEKSYRPEHDDGEQDIPPICSEQDLSQTSLSLGMLSPALSFEDVFDNADSPVFRGHITWKQASSQRQSQVTDSTNWKTPPSVVPDSQPDNNRAILAFSTPTRVLELYLQNIESPDRSSNATTRRLQSMAEICGKKSSGSQSTQSHDSRGNRTPASSEIRSSSPSMAGQTLRDRSQNTSSPVFGPLLRRYQATSETDINLSSSGKQQSLPRSSQNHERDAHTSPEDLEHNLRSRSQDSTSSPISIRSSLGEVQVPARAQTDSPFGISQSQLQSQDNETDTSTSSEIQGHGLRNSSQNIALTNPRSSLRFSQNTTEVNANLSSEDRQDQAELPRGRASIEKQSSPSTGCILQNRSQNTASFPVLSSSLKRTRLEASSSPNISSTASIPGISFPELALPQKSQCTEVATAQGSKSKNSSFDSITSNSQTTLLSASRIEIAAPMLEIHAPVPATSTADFNFTSVLTTPLIEISQKMPLYSHFRPSSQTRELRPLERGYWAIDSSSWDLQLRKSFWYVLYDFIGRGAAGWGVWCTRDGDFTGFRVFCWGGIAGHIYLLLHMASASKIKRKGATWISGDGEVAIQMPCKS